MRPWTADLVDAVSTACRLSTGAGTGDARRVVNNTGRRVGGDAGVLARLSLQQLDLKLDTQTTTKKTFNGPLFRTTRVSRYQKGRTNLDFTEARDSEWQWHQLGNMEVCTSLQQITCQHPTTQFLQARCPSCHPTNSVKALKADFFYLGNF